MNEKHHRFEDEFPENPQMQSNHYAVNIIKPDPQEGPNGNNQNFDDLKRSSKKNKNKSKKRQRQLPTDGTLHQPEQEKPPLRVQIRQFIIFLNILVSFTWGLILLYDYYSILRPNLMIIIFFVLCMFLHLFAIISSILLVVVLYILWKLCLRPDSNNLVGCIPIFFGLFTYCGYFTVISLGAHVLVVYEDQLIEPVATFVVYEAVVSLVIVILSISDFFLERNLVSMHLIQMEKDVYVVNELDIKNFRQEVISARDALKSNSPSPQLSKNTSVAGRASETELQRQSKFKKNLAVTSHEGINYSPSRTEKSEGVNMQLSSRVEGNESNVEGGMKLSLKRNEAGEGQEMNKSNASSKQLKMYVPGQSS